MPLLNFTTMNKEETTKYQLEELLDGSSVSELLELLGTICFEKADHIRESYSDYTLAKHWEKHGKKLQQFASKF